MLSLIISVILNSVVHIEQKVPIDDRQLYYESCLIGTQKFLSGRYPSASSNAVDEVVKKDCDETMTFIEQQKAWGQIKEPAKEGCWDSVALNLKGKPRAEIELNQKDTCGSAENVSSRE